MQKIDDVNVTTAKSTEEIVANIKENVSKSRKELTSSNFWREEIPIALVGGGPSLKKIVKELEDYKYIMACGSVHDYLISKNIIPDYCVLCDPDEIMGNYIKSKSYLTKYLVASQCDPSIFRKLNNNEVYIWHAGGYAFKESPYGEDKMGIGGGCTVGTRAICIALGMGFSNIHLFGFDTCLGENFEHHAYEFTDKEKESIGNITEIRLGGTEGKKFYVASYHLGQLFDFKKILAMYADRLQITVHGSGLLNELMELAKKESLR